MLGGRLFFLNLFAVNLQLMHAAVPKLAAIPAFLGSLCLLSQYMLEQVSYLFHADGNNVCVLPSAICDREGQPSNWLGLNELNLGLG